MPWMYIRHGHCAHRNRCLRVKAAFAAKAAIIAVVVVVAGENLVLVATTLVMVDPVDGFSVSVERAFP